MTTELALPTIELVSTLRAAPANGSPSSGDYNDSWTESLADSASLAGFLNDILIPILNGLSITIQPNINDTPSGIEGRFIFTDTTDTSAIFFDTLSDSSLNIADSLRVVNGIITTLQTLVNNLNVQVIALQSQLSSTDQNDIAQALQNLTALLQTLSAQVQANTIQISNIQAQLTSSIVIRVSANTVLTPSVGVAVVVAGGGGVTITLPFAQTNLKFTIKSDYTSTGIVSVATVSSQLVDGFPSPYVLVNPNQYITVIGDGIGWNIIANN